MAELKNNYFDHMKWIIIRNISILLALSTAILTVLSYFDQKKEVTLIYLLCCVFSVILTFFIIRFKLTTSVYFTFSAISTVLCTYALFFTDNDAHIADYLWRTTVILMAYIGLKKRYAIIVTIYFIIDITIYVHYYLVDNYFQVQFNSSYLYTLNFEIIVPIVINSYLIYNFISLYAKSNKNLEEANLKLISTNEENITLLKEIHHRVKNNLQIVTSLLRLQRNEIEDHVVKKQFTSAINRVLAMANIHEKLYQQKELSKLTIEPYIKDLCKELKETYAQDQEIEFTYTFEVKTIELNVIIPLGLIINELLTNTFKYAFRDTNKEKYINIEVTSSNEGFILKYSDNGVWFDNPETNHFGTELIAILTEQINGSFEISKTESGTFYDFLIKNS